MNTALESIAEDVELLPAPSVPAAVLTPTPTEIDGMIEEYDQAKRLHLGAKTLLDEHKAIAIFYADHWGTVPAQAKQSRRLQGKLHTLTVTRSETITVNEPKVAELAIVLMDSDRSTLFDRLFSISVKHKLLEGAAEVLRIASLPERLERKVLSLFGQCFTVETASPSVKVELRAAEKTVKAGKKGGR